MKTRRRMWFVLIGVAVAALSSIAFYAYQFAGVGTAYAAHMLCSGVFVSARSPQSILAADLAADDLAQLRYIDTDIDMRGRRVRAHLLGLAAKTATYRDGQGCVVTDGNVPALVNLAATQPSREDDGLDTPNLTADASLERVIEWAFAEPEPARLKRTRAIVVVRNGRVGARWARHLCRSQSVNRRVRGRRVVDLELTVVNHSQGLACPIWRGRVSNHETS